MLSHLLVKSSSKKSIRPEAPPQVGIWDWKVRSFKRVMFAILGTRRLTALLLTTKFCQVACFELAFTSARKR